MPQNDSVILELCENIERVYDESIELIKSKNELLNTDKRLTHIVSYSIVLFGYCKEIAILQKMSWNNSIDSVLRNTLECYGVIKKLEGYYDAGSFDEFDEYIQYLYLQDINQDIKTYKILLGDVTISNVSKRDKEAKTFIERFKMLIKKYFPDQVTNIDANNELESIKQIVNTLNGLLSKYHNTKVKLVGNAISKNEAIIKANRNLPYDGSYTIYPELCKFSHNNISSIEDRIIHPQHKVFSYNTANKNIKSVISLAYFTSLDLINILKDILK